MTRNGSHLGRLGIVAGTALLGTYLMLGTGESHPRSTVARPVGPPDRTVHIREVRPPSAHGPAPIDVGSPPLAADAADDVTATDAALVRRVGDLLVYRLRADYRTAVRALPSGRSAGGAADALSLADLHTHVEGGLEVRLDADAAEASVLSCRFRDLTVERTSQPPPGGSTHEEEANLGLKEPAPVLLRVDGLGRVSGVGLPEGLDPKAADLLQALLAEVVFFLPAGDAERWETAESDLTGAYRGTWYRSSVGADFQVVKQKEYTGTIAGAPAGPGAALEVRPVHEGQTTYLFARDTGWLRTCRGRARARIEGVQSALPATIDQVQELDLDLVSRRQGQGGDACDAAGVGAAGGAVPAPAQAQVAAAPDGLAAGPAGRVVASDGPRKAAEGEGAAGACGAGAPGQGAAPAEAAFRMAHFAPQVTAAQIDAAAQRTIAAADPLAGIVGRLEEALAGSRFERAAVESFHALQANFSTSEPAIADAVARLPGADPRLQGLLLDALAACGSGTAEAAVLDVASRAANVAALRDRATRALSGARAPADATVAWLEATLRDPDLGATAAYALGSIGHRSPDAPRDRIAAALEERLRAGDLPAVNVLDALGNNGAAGSLPALLGAAQDPQELVRAATLRALRSYAAPAASAALAQALRADASAAVRRAAAEAAGRRADDATRDALADRVFADPDADVRRAALDALIERAPQDAPAVPIVVSVATTSPDDSLRARATRALPR